MIWESVGLHYADLTWPQVGYYLMAAEFRALRRTPAKLLSDDGRDRLVELDADDEDET